MNELIKVKKELVKERDAQAALIGALKSEVANYTAKIGTMDTELAASSEEMATLKESSAN